MPMDAVQIAGILVAVGIIAALIGMAIALRRERRALKRLKEELEQRISAETRLRESEERFRACFHFSLVGIAVSSPDLHCLDCSEKLYEMLGKSPREMLGKSLLEFTHPDDRSTEKVEIEKVRSGESDGYTVAKRFVRSDGSTLSARVAVRCIRHLDGAPAYFLSLVQDITELHQAQAEALQQVRFAQILSDAIPNPIFYKDPQGRYLGCNKAFETLLGLTRDQLIGKTAADIAPTPQAQLYEEMDAKLLREGGVQTYESSLVSADGARYDVMFHKALYPAPDGSIGGLVGVILDITARKQIERDLLMFQRALEETSDAVGILDLDRRVTYLNQAAKQLCGYSLEELNALGGPKTLYEDPSTATRIFAALSQGESFVGEVILRTHANDRLTILLRGDAIVDEQGQVIGIIGIHTDITDRKRAEEQLAANAQALVLANRQLEESIETANRLALQAEMASTAKSEFLASMSHEIRTPLNGIIGMTALLLDSDLSDEERECAETIRSSGETLLATINDILDFSKIEAGKIEIERIEFSPRSVIEEVGDVLAGRAQEKGIEFVTDVDPHVPATIVGDPAKVRQILLNLAGNAVKFTQTGEVVIEAHLEEQTQESIALRFDVSDTGIGIEADRLATLFQPFTQADAGTTRKFGGTGLGLAISKRLAAAMGGSLDVRTKPDAGSVFTFVGHFAKAETETLFPSGLENVRVLIIDDSAATRCACRHVLSEWGCLSEEAPNAAAAVEALTRAANEGIPFDIALIDLRMPRVNGIELARRIRANPATAPTRLVLMTPVAERANAAALAQRGFAGCTTKPLKRTALHRSLCDAMGMANVTVVGGRHTLLAVSAQDRARYRILVAEDNSVNQKVVSRMLQRMGYRHEIVNNGREAVEAARRGDYDLILMDCHMPEMDGFEATAAIRANERGERHVPVLAMTALVTRGDLSRCLESGMDDYLTKPMLPPTLEAKLDQWLMGKKRPHPARQDAPAPKPPDPPCLDRERLRSICPDDPRAQREIMDLFVSDTAMRLSLLDRAMAEGDAPNVRQLAHSIKGAAGNIGADPLHKLAYALEQYGAAGDLPGAGPALEQLRAELGRIRAFLRETPPT